MRKWHQTRSSAHRGASLLPPYFPGLLLCVLGPFQGQTSVVQTQDLNLPPSPQGVLPSCRGWEVCHQRHRKGDPAKWLDASKGKGERLRHRKNLAVKARMGATHTHPRTACSWDQFSQEATLIRATLQTFLRSSTDPVGPPGS